MSVGYTAATVLQLQEHFQECPGMPLRVLSSHVHLKCSCAVVASIYHLLLLRQYLD